MMNGKYYGNSSNGYSYSPDRSRDVDRFNPSTRANYPTGYITSGYGYSGGYGGYNHTTSKKGRYLGNGQYVKE